MKKCFKILFLLISLFVTNIYAQVGINTNTPDKNAVLDLNTASGTSSKGLLMPKIALTATNSAAPLTAHSAGMYVYNTATAGSGATAVSPGEYYNDGTQWVRALPAAWNTYGNYATTAVSNFLGTTDAVDLVAKTNNVERLRVASSGQLLIGTTTIPTTAANAKVIIDNGAAAGALQIIDGTQADGKMFTSDVDGIGTWKSKVPVFTTGVKPAVNKTYSQNVWFYTGYSVKVPIGYSTVSAGFFNRVALSGFMQYYMSQSSTVLNSRSVGMDIKPNMSGFPVFGPNVNIGQATFYINNTTGAAVTLYIWGYGQGVSSIDQRVVSLGEPFILVAY